MAGLLFALTVLARDTYTVGGNGLDDPERMRRFNELMHHTVTQLRSEISGGRGLPDDVFGKMVGEEVEALGFSAGALRKLVGQRDSRSLSDWVNDDRGAARQR